VVPPVTNPSVTNPWDWSTTGPGTSSSDRPESGSSSDHSGSGSASGSSSSGSDDSTDSSSGSSSSGSGSSGSGSSGSSSGGYAGTTSGVELGAASCPSGVGTGTTTSTPTSAIGSVVAGAVVPQTNTSGVASVTDVAGTHVGTATSSTSQTLGATGGASSVAGTSSVAGSALGAAASAAGRANMPGELIDLSYWYLTLPTGQQGSPDTIQNPNLERFTNEFFKMNPSRDGVEFSANGAGVTTKNSHYPRSELREMNGSEKASWSNTTGSHTLDVCEAITKVPTTKPEVVAAQIHDDKDDVLQIRLEGQTLMVQYADGKSEAVIDPAYKLGTPYNVRIIAADSRVDVYYNGQKKAELPLSGSGWYWKVGAYVQSNSSKGDGAEAVGEVTVYSLKCVHSG
jgi:hypothetical protein